MLESLIQAGYFVTLGAWARPGRVEDGPQRAQRIQRVEAMGARVIMLRDVRTPRVAPSTIRGVGAILGTVDLARLTLRPRLEDFYPKASQWHTFQPFLAEARPDVIVGYALGSLAAAHGQRTAPRLAVMVDLPHLVSRFRWRTTSPRETRRWLRGALAASVSGRQRDWTLRLLSECAGVLEMAAHHAHWLRAHGILHGRYLPKPTHDLGGPNWRAERTRAQAGSHKPRVVLIGNLRGAATRPGLYLLAHEVLPRLERQFGPDGFEVHVIGKYAPPDDLRSALARPSVRLRGFVEDVRPEFFAADVLFVPTPIELGTRTRIIVGASFGACTVAHAANVLGIPEFRHQQDILLGQTGADLADKLARALADPALRQRLGDQARRTFETHFSAASAGARFVAEVERVAATASEHRSPTPLAAGLPA